MSNSSMMKSYHDRPRTAYKREIQMPRIPRETSPNRLFVGNLHLSVSEGDLIKLFLPFGEIKNLSFLWHTEGPNRGKPRGWAFIDFESAASASAAISALDGLMFKGRSMAVKLSDESCGKRSTLGDVSEAEAQDGHSVGRMTGVSKETSSVGKRALEESPSVTSSTATSITATTETITRSDADVHAAASSLSAKRTKLRDLDDKMRKLQEALAL